MNVIALKSCQFGEHLDLLAAMYRLRHRVFKERLDWSVSVSGEFELDLYDALNPVYLLVMSDDRTVVGCVRLLPTTGPTMLAETFPVLLGGQPAPRDDRILESSRFCIDTKLVAELADNGLNRATFMLFAAMIEYSRIAKVDSIVIIRDCLNGEGRERVEAFVPRYMSFPIGHYDSEKSLSLARAVEVINPLFTAP